MLSSKLALGSANSKSIFNSLTIYINESFLPEHAPSVKPSLTVDDHLFKVNTGTGTVHFFFVKCFSMSKMTKRIKVKLKLKKLKIQR